MKKVFVEPEIKKIELNLSENIANSGGKDIFGFRFWIDMYTCTIQETNKYYHEVTFKEAEDYGCKVMDDFQTRGGMVIPVEVLRMHMK